MFPLTSIFDVILWVVLPELIKIVMIVDVRVQQIGFAITLTGLRTGPERRKVSVSIVLHGLKGCLKCTDIGQGSHYWLGRVKQNMGQWVSIVSVPPFLYVFLSEQIAVNGAFMCNILRIFYGMFAN